MRVVGRGERCGEGDPPRSGMDQRLRRLAHVAAQNHAVISLRDIQRTGAPPSVVHGWIRDGPLERIGRRAFTFVGSDDTWLRRLAAGVADLDGHGTVSGRSAARLHRLDGFEEGPLEFVLPRPHRQFRTEGLVVSTSQPITARHIAHVDGLRVVTAERLILDAPRFRFSRREIENSIDSALRKRLVVEQRLRAKVVEQHSRGINRGRMLLDALVDTGGESRLERWFLGLVRRAGLPRPQLQVTQRDGSRVVARVDALFPGGLVVEVSGHGTHSTRRQRQSDAQRHTELTIRGLRVLTFTYEDVRERPEWVAARIRQALSTR